VQDRIPVTLTALAIDDDPRSPETGVIVKNA
jgi:hypothetical protein